MPRWNDNDAGLEDARKISAQLCTQWTNDVIDRCSVFVTHGLRVIGMKRHPASRFGRPVSSPYPVIGSHTRLLREYPVPEVTENIRIPRTCVPRYVCVICAYVDEIFILAGIAFWARASGWKPHRQLSRIISFIFEQRSFANRD